MRLRQAAVFGALCLLLLQPCRAGATTPGEAADLRDVGVAELENERPIDAEKAFRRLIEIAAGDPLGHANLAIALLRQQKHAEALSAVGRALERAPGRPDLLSIEGEILAADGQLDEALRVLADAARGAPDDPETQFALARHAATVDGDQAKALAGEALERLADLRPENLVVNLQRARSAVGAGDRATASSAYLRIKELSWNAPPAAAQLLERILGALADGKLEQARTPSLQLENVLKVTNAYQRSLQELYIGIQGRPILRFASEPPAESFGDPLPVAFRASRLDSGETLAAGLVAADFDGDGRGDVARIRGGSPRILEVRLASSQWKVDHRFPVDGAAQLLVADLDNDGALDLGTFGANEASVFRGNGRGAFEAVAGAFGLGGGAAAVAADFDADGDLDVAVAGGKAKPLELHRNAGPGRFEAIGAAPFPKLGAELPRAMRAADVDRDGDLDLVIASGKRLVWLSNQRQGRFEDRGEEAGLASASGVESVVSADLDNDGRPDLLTAGRQVAIWRNAGGGRFEGQQAAVSSKKGKYSSPIAFDADNDGRLEVAAILERRLVLVGQRPSLVFEAISIEGSPGALSIVAAADLDADGDVDLVAGGPSGLYRLDNEGGNRNHWLSVRLRGLKEGNGKNNLFGFGATIEVRSGSALQYREVVGPVTHLGLGKRKSADVLRVVWTNGVPQNRLRVGGDQSIVEEQVLKGSCPMLFAWNGQRYEFVTDLLWNAPLGLPVGLDVWAGAEPEELVEVRGAVPDRGVYRLAVTEELWEAAYFDRARLWVVDAPPDVAVASNLRVVPGRKLGTRLLGSRGVRPVAAAWDGAGREATEQVARRDEVYADGFEEGPYQGVSARPWSFTFDLGEAPAAPIRLLLEGWIFPSDASLNIAMAQRADLERPSPRLEVETPNGWRTLVADLGHPAGKTKTMVVDTPPLPAGSHRLRIVSALWLSWDQIAWTRDIADDALLVRAKLDPSAANLRYRGFSRVRRQAPNAPHVFDYEHVRRDSPWLPFRGPYTRYGDVRPLLDAADDRVVIFGPGDELAIGFDAATLPRPPAGWIRSVFLESTGWDKDADRNTYEASGVEPLPFHEMSGYPYAPGETYPDDAFHRDYRREWLIREAPGAE